MLSRIFNKSALHNLVITNSIKASDKELKEGLILPESIMRCADIKPFERVIATNVSRGGRVYTFALEGEENQVEARGSLAPFLNKGDLICIMTSTIAGSGSGFPTQKAPAIDFHLDPLKENNNDAKKGDLALVFDGKSVDIEKPSEEVLVQRAAFPRFMLRSIVTGLVVTHANPYCEKGSAEVPEEILEKANIKRREVVIVTNVTQGGYAETYAEPTPRSKGIVLTTGAMSKFGKVGDIVSVMTFGLSTKPTAEKPLIVDVYEKKNRLN